MVNVGIGICIIVYRKMTYYDLSLDTSKINNLRKYINAKLGFESEHKVYQI